MQPTPDEVRAELERVLASGSFAGTSRLSRFLRFVVEQSLAGEAERLKEYVIGVEVFDRDERYDPRIDSIVRVEAGRLRARLDEYYRGAGAIDVVAIVLEKGSYAPAFVRRAGDGHRHSAREIVEVLGIPGQRVEPKLPVARAVDDDRTHLERAVLRIYSRLEQQLRVQVARDVVRRSARISELASGAARDDRKTA